MKLTGERVVTSAGRFNPTWQRHVAAYKLADGFLPQGRLLDVGCGIGHSYQLLAPRVTVGLDISAEALAGQDRETVEADMREIPFGDGEFAAVLSVQSLEHVPDPERVVAEVARVLAAGGTAMFVTPNRLTLGRPDEIIDPYHFREFDHAELADLCRQHFDRVQIPGLFGSPRYMELVNEERAKLDRLLAQGPAAPAPIVPVRIKQKLYDALLSRQRNQPDPRAEAIEVDDFELRDDRPARRPRRLRGLPASRGVTASDPEPRRPTASGAAPRSTTGPSTCTAARAARRAARRPPTRRPRRRSSPTPTATGTGPRPNVASTSPPTRSSAARAACRPRGSTRSRRPGRCSTSAQGTAR